MSFSQKSQWYVKEKGQFEYLVPDTIEKNPELKKEFDNALCLQASQMCEAELEAFIFGCRFIFRLLGACCGDENNDFLSEELLKIGGEAIWLDVMREYLPRTKKNMAMV